MEEIKRLLDLYQKMVIDSEADRDANKEKQTSSNFESRIRLNGRPILPPLMTDQKRREMAAIRNLAIKKQEAIEQRSKQILIDKVQAIVDTIDDTKSSFQENQDISSQNIHLQVDAGQLNQQCSQTVEKSSLNAEQRHGDGSMQPKSGHVSNTSIVTLSSSGSDLDSPVDVNEAEVYKILNQLSQPNTLDSGSTKPKEAALSSSSGTENSCLMQTVVSVGNKGQEVDSITVLNKDSMSENVTSMFDKPGNFENLNVQESLDLEKVRESVSDSEVLKNYVGEYSLLPTPGPSSTPDVSFVSPEFITHGGLLLDTDIKDDSGNDNLIGTTTGSSFFSLDTIGQSCTLPVSFVTESTCSTLHEVVEPWNMPQEFVQNKDEKSSSFEIEETTPAPSHMRRNSYTLDHPSPALLEAQAQNRAPHVQDKLFDDQAHSKPVRRALDLSDDFQATGIGQTSIPDKSELDRKIIQVPPKNNSPAGMSTHKTSPDSQYDDFQSKMNRETQNKWNESKEIPNMSITNQQIDPSQPAISTMEIEDVQHISNDDPLSDPTMMCLKESDDESAMTSIYLQQHMDLLESMQKKMMEEQHRQLESLMHQQKLQQRKMQEEMTELEKQIRERKTLTPDQEPLRRNYVDARSSEGVELHSKYDERSLPLTRPSLAHGAIDGTSHSPSLVHGASDFASPIEHHHLVGSSKVVGNEEHIAKWTAPTLQNLKVHNGRHFDKVSAVTKGYLTRRLMKTDKVQSVIRTIKDMWQFIWQFQTETPVKRGVLSSSDTVLANRVLSQLRAAQFELDDIFFGIAIGERMAILTQQRIMDEEKSKTRKNQQGHFISTVTRKAIERRQQIRPAEIKVFGRPQTAPPANCTRTTTQNPKTSGKPGKSKQTGSKDLSEEKPSRYLSKSVKISHGGVSKAKSSSPSRRGRKTSHPFSRPLSAASRRSTRASAPKS